MGQLREGDLFCFLYLAPVIARSKLIFGGVTAIVVRRLAGRWIVAVRTSAPRVPARRWLLVLASLSSPLSVWRTEIIVVVTTGRSLDLTSCDVESRAGSLPRTTGTSTRARSSSRRDRC